MPDSYNISKIVDKWKPLLSNISQEYYGDVALYLERFYGMINDDNYDQKMVDGVSHSIFILNKIDLSKVIFTDDITIVYDYKFSFKHKKNYSIDYYPYTDYKTMMETTIMNEIYQSLNKMISGTGGIIIYKLLDKVYQDEILNDIQITYSSKLVDFKGARFAKIKKIRNKI